MRVCILGDKQRKFDGVLVAEFQENDNKHFLSFDLDNWENAAKNGFIGGEFIRITTPEPMNLTFDQEYDLSLESARKVYCILCKNGWTPFEKGKDK